MTEPYIPEVRNGRISLPIPDNTIEVDLSFSAIKSLPKELPSTLKKLYLTGCEKIQTLPDTLPDTIEELDLSFSDIASLPEKWPSNLKKLNLFGCEKIQTLPDTLPNNIEELYLSRTPIKELPEELPSNLKMLDLGGCHALIITPELRERFNQLEKNNCSILYPEHFMRDQVVKDAIEQLNDLIGVYHDSNPDKPKEHALKTLARRFLNEGNQRRGGSEAIVTAFEPLLETLKENPNHLEWMDEVADYYLKGCVNQPVFGMSYMNGWVSVVNADTMNDKLHAARQILALDEIVSFIANSSEKPGAGVEVEAGNALLREVHVKLINENNMDPWPGVPGPIIYEDAITSWLTDEMISNATKHVRKQVMDKPVDFVLNQMCERHHADHWAKAVFPEQTQQIIDKYMEKYYNQEEDGPVLMEQRRQEILASSRQATIDQLQHEQQARHGVAGVYNPNKKSIDTSDDQPLRYTQRLEREGSTDVTTPGVPSR